MGRKSMFSAVLAGGPQGAGCRDCGEEMPFGADYCISCGAQKGGRRQARLPEPSASRIQVGFPGEKELRTILKGRRKRGGEAALKSALARQVRHREAPHNFTLRCLPGLAVSPRDYQVEAAVSVLSRMHGRAVLADEVGLGKTIEAGLVLKELDVRRKGRRFLILVPSSLVEQWKEELSHKFGLAPAGHDTRAFWRKRVVVLSLTRAKSPRLAPLLQAREWDAVVVDEAHSLKNSRTIAHNFVKSLSARRLLLLTATPIENELRELYNLLSLVDAAVYPTYRRFARAFLSSKYAVRDVGALRRFCRTFMVRQRREIVFPELPQRVPQVVRYEPTATETRLLDSTLNFVRLLYPRTVAVGGKEARGATILFITLLLKESCSSPEAVLSTLTNSMLPKLNGSEKAALETIIADGRKVGATAKMVAFLDEVPRLGESAIAYVEFFETHRRLTRLLEERGHEVVPYTGRMSASEKLASLDRFRKQGGLLLCTEVGGQGLNLQHCNVVVHYDVPWNPMRLEQRVGRVHRFGQEKPTRVVHLVSRGTYEERVFELLTLKLGLFSQAVGEVESVLSFLEEEESLQHQVARAICESEDDTSLARRFGVLGEQVKGAADRFRRSRVATARILDGES